MSEFGEGGDAGETTIKVPEIQTPANTLSPEGMSAMQGIQEGQPEVTDTAESVPAAISTENPVAPQSTGTNLETQFAPPGTGGSQDEALAKERPSEVLTPKGISAIQGRGPIDS